MMLLRFSAQQRHHFSYTLFVALRTKRMAVEVVSSPFKQRFVVGVAVEAMNNYGRLILRGIHRYANARREWLLHEEMRPAMIDFKRWPKCDGAIFAGLTVDAAIRLSRKSRHVVSCSSTTD